MVEHDALGAAGGSAGVDQQRQRGVVAPTGVRPSRLALVHLVGDQHLGTGVGKLIADLLRRQRGVDRRDRRTQPPRGEQRHHELDGVRQLDRHHVARRHALAAQRRGGTLDGVEKLGVVQVAVVVGDRVPQRIVRRALIWQDRQVHVIPSETGLPL